MSALQLTPSSNALAGSLSTLARLYEQGQASEMIECTLNKLMAYEAELARSQLSQLNADVAEYEQKYSVSTAEFFRRFHAGQTDDRMDFVEWAALAQMADNLRRRLLILTGEEQA